MAEHFLPKPCSDIPLWFLGFSPGPILIPAIDLVFSENVGEVVSGSEPSINEVEDQVADHDLIGPGHVQGEAFVVSTTVAIPDHPLFFILDKQLPVAVKRTNNYFNNENNATLDHELALLSLSPIRFDKPRPSSKSKPSNVSDQIARGRQGQGQAIRVKMGDLVLGFRVGQTLPFICSITFTSLRMHHIAGGYNTTKHIPPRLPTWKATTLGTLFRFLAYEGCGQNSRGSNSRLTLLHSTPFRTFELSYASANRTTRSLDYPTKRLMDTPYPDEPLSQWLKTFLKRPMDKMHANNAENHLSEEKKANIELERHIGSLKSELKTIVSDEVKKAIVEDEIATQYYHSDPWWDTYELGF
ncbi:hypothetical protein PanWU01x14_144780 [Parasponia andersonii]|uniref:Uncharacterized protein n=1 Tax=Parasponia andersonii TaxID=3476 RepID=A0A2P5CKH6_PARAD|nr:hypothetical protein PanWU01x14_144780 [Parasponia andersonii]